MPGDQDGDAAVEAMAKALRRLFARQASTVALGEPTSAERAERADLLMRAWSQARSEVDDLTDAADLLCELMHWCRRAGVSFGEALRFAGGHFLQECAVANAYAAGYRAHGAGLPLQPNPHDGPTRDPERGAMWHAGWQDAAAGREPREPLEPPPDEEEDA